MTEATLRTKLIRLAHTNGNLVETIGGLLDDPRWLLKTIEQGFDKGLKVAKHL